MNIFKTNKILYSIIIIELLSLIAYFNAWSQPFVFFALLLVFSAICFVSLESGLLIVLSEIMIGSFGYLFWFESSGSKISIRIALFLVFMSVWLARLLLSSIKARGIMLPLSQEKFTDIFSPKKNQMLSAYWVLLFFIAVGMMIGIVSDNAPADVFFDSNAWLYFLLFIPLIDIITKSETFFNNFKIIFFTSTGWLAFKTFALLYIFSHNLVWMTEIYRWVRDTRVGEITLLEGGYYRVFFQSHIYLLTGLFVLLALSFEYSLQGKSLLTNLFSKLKNALRFFERDGNYVDKKFIYFFLISLYLAVNFLTFSRSNWLGLAAGLAVYFIGLLILYKTPWKKLLVTPLYLVLSSLASLVLITIIVQFPYPDPQASISASDILSKRAQTISGEAGASSRWNLLPELVSEINRAPVFGGGFGQTVTYISNDPRVRETSPDGTYETFAFEWGWLDIWIKLGLFGLLAYLYLIFTVLKNAYDSLIKKPDYFVFGFSVSLVAVSAVNVFSPYLNHPLGIVLLLIAGVLPKMKK